MLKAENRKQRENKTFYLTTKPMLTILEKYVDETILLMYFLEIYEGNEYTQNVIKCRSLQNFT